ncbi:hypothetical protein Tco_1551914 [Tanacetum coccineum]
MITNSTQQDIMEGGSMDRPSMLAKGEDINKWDVETKLFWEFGKFTSIDGETLKSYYMRFYKMMNEMARNELNV